MKRKETLFKAGDIVPGFCVAKDWEIIPENRAILEILDLPESQEDQKKLIRATIDRYYSQGRTRVTLILGENLADDPRIAGFVEVEKMYVMEV